jgi:hypothetical protein
LVTITPDDRAQALLEDLTFLAQTGAGASEAARRTGFNHVKTLDKYLRRHGRGDLMQRLVAQDYWPIGHPPTRGIRRAS